MLACGPWERPRKLPKVECCVVQEAVRAAARIRMLKEGSLPDGYTVKKRKLVRVDGKKVKKKQLSKAA